MNYSIEKLQQQISNLYELLDAYGSVQDIVTFNTLVSDVHKKIDELELKIAAQQMWNASRDLWQVN